MPLTQPADFLQSTLAEDVAARARLRLAEAYLAGIPGHDLERFDGDQLFALIAGLQAFMRERPPGAPKLRLFDPDPDRHGWASPHSVVEIVNDDMPFLVDSVAMVLAR